MAKISIMVMAFVIMFSAAPILAQDVEPATEPTLTTTTVEDDGSKVEARNQRIEARKAAQEDKMDAKRESIIVRKCEGAQNRLVGLAERVQAVTTKRERLYTSYGEKFSGFMTRLDDAGVDTTELSEVLGTYSDMTEELGVDFGQYEMSLTDMAEMDCTDDPEGFEATLREARQLSNGLKDVIKELHDYLRTEVRQAFTRAMNAYNNSNNSGDTDTENAVEPVEAQ